MAIRKHGNSWEVDVYVNGKRVKRRVKRKKEAGALEQELIAKNVTGETVERIRRSEMTFAELAPMYLEWAKAQKSANTYRVESSCLNSQLLPFFGRYTLDQIDASLIERFKMKRKQDGVGNRIVNIELTLLSVMFKHAQTFKLARSNPTRDVQKFKVAQRQKSYLKEDEIVRLLEAARGTHLYPLIICSLHAGLRKAELFNLHWTDIDFDANTLTVQPKGDWHTKNYQSRTLEMTPVLRETLLAVPRVSDYVLTYNGRRLTSNVTRALKRIAGKANVEGLTLHVLRHTFCTHLAKRIPIVHLQQLMGHKEYRTTLGYVHVSQESVKGDTNYLPYARKEES